METGLDENFGANPMIDRREMMKRAGMAALATGFGLAASIAGLLVSYHANLPSGPAIVLAAGLLFGISLVATGALRRMAPMIGWDA